MFKTGDIVRLYRRGLHYKVLQVGRGSIGDQTKYSYIVQPIEGGKFRSFSEHRLSLVTPIETFPIEWWEAISE